MIVAMRILPLALLAAAIPGWAQFAGIEFKRPLSAAQHLKVSQDAASISVTGETFLYRFGKGHGLITGVAVLGQELTAGVPIPELTVAEQIDRTHMPYAARHETRARVSVASAAPERVVIRSEGGYARQDGSRFPLAYSITYEIGIDGVVLVEVANTATADCTLRWLTLSGGAIRDSLARFISHMPEQASSQSSLYQFRPIDAKEDKILAGTFLPWFWLGNQRVGLEVTTWSANSQTYNRVDGSSRRDQHEMFAVWREGDRVEWENFLIRNSSVFAPKGWKRGGQFALAVTPSKKFDPYYAMLKGAHLGPHQHRAQSTVPDEGQIRALAQNGYNMMVGVANWRSGEYVPLNDGDVRRTIELAHQYGLKIIPYITFVDLAHATEEWRRHGEEWAIEPTQEFIRNSSKFRDPQVEMAWRTDVEGQTTLMCPGAPGWRAHWKKQIDRIVDNYDFDGLYIDFWYGRMVCENTRHGCGGRFRTFTALGHRDMLMHAYNRVKAKNPRAVIKANTNLLSTALLTSGIELRLVGESIDVTTMDPDSRQWLYSSYRLGQPSEFLWAGSKWDKSQRNWFAALVNFLPQYYGRPPMGQPRTSYDDFDVFRFFGAADGEWTLGIHGQSPAGAGRADVSVNTVRKGGAMLATFINTAQAAVAAQSPVGANRIAYDPLGEQLAAVEGGELSVPLEPFGYRTFLLAERPAEPRLLFALGAHGLKSENWDRAARRLTFSVDAPPETPLRFSVWAPSPVKSVTGRDGRAVEFRWSAATGLALFEAAHGDGGLYRVQF
jgi:hypothetical protein